MLTLAPMALAHAAAASRAFAAPRRAPARGMNPVVAHVPAFPRDVVSSSGSGGAIIGRRIGSINRSFSAVHRASRRPALVATRALSDGDADKWELAQAMMRMRRTQDEALELILNEVSTLSKEVRSLRAELDELKGGSNGGVVVNAPVGTEDKVVQPVGKSSPDRDVLNEMLNALIPESESDSPSPIKPDERKPEPEPETDDDLPPVVLDVAGWRGDGSDRSVSWPMCKTGEDDLYLMATIQAALNEAGFWAGEEDEADMYFGPSTQEALCYFQASVGLPEVGYVDPETWRALLGDDKYAWGPAPGAIGFDEKAAENEVSSAQTSASAELSDGAKAAKEWSETVVSMVDNPDNDPGDDAPLWGDEKTRVRNVSEEFTQLNASGDKWPVLRQEDGGMEVHKLHVLLDGLGYYSGEEDMEWWTFGMGTENALGTFQASSGLPDTGLTCLLTWKALLGEERVAMGPAAAFETVGELESGEYTMDLSQQDRVFLLGEGRFEGSK